MKITITINTDNAAFGDPETPLASLRYRDEEIARILRDLAGRFISGLYPERLYDINGNTVGQVRITG